jgi:osmotically-inducible protein OsmY
MNDLRSRIAARLSASNFHQLRTLEIDVERDTVTLRGEVNSFHERQVAVNAAIGVEGVGRVVDRMNVRL